MPTIAVLCAAVLAAFAATLPVSALVALADADWRALEALALLTVGYAGAASGMLLALRTRTRSLNRAGQFAAAVAMWVTLALGAAPAFMLAEGQGLAEAIFEGTSAVVTLGITLEPVGGLSPAMIWYRGVTGWTGGMMTLFMAVYVLGPFRVGGTPNRDLRLIQHSQTFGSRGLLRTARAIAYPYIALTLLCALLLVLVQVPPQEALILGMGMLATNGFIPMGSPGTVLGNPAAELIMMVFMLVGATSILWHRMLIERRWREDAMRGEGARYLLAILAVVVIVMIASVFMPDPLHSRELRAFNFAFDIVSVMTTTGITHDPRLGLGLPFEFVLLLALVGGCAYSTAGGIKFFRLAGMLHHLHNELRRLVHPHAALPDAVDFDPEERERARAIWSAFFLAILGLTIAVLVFGALGIALPEALGLATGAFSQVGNIAAAGLPEAVGGTSPPALLLGVSLLALLGRIEILVVLAALAVNRW